MHDNSVLVASKTRKMVPAISQTSTIDIANKHMEAPSDQHLRAKVSIMLSSSPFSLLLGRSTRAVSLCDNEGF